MNLMQKLANTENEFLKSQFIGPVLKDSKIRVRITGVVLELRTSYEGWGVFRPLNFKKAKFVRDPSFKEKYDYLALFPALRFVLCKKTDRWYGVPAHESDARFKISGQVPIDFAEEVQVFDVVQARFDGANCWFERVYEKTSGKNAMYLRESLINLVEPKDIGLPGLTQEEKIAYNIAYDLSEEAKKTREENRIKDALSRGGATYLGHVERQDTFTIEFNVDGQRHRSVINKRNLYVQSAGVCLAGYDNNFDLQSLVGVLREGQNEGLIYRTGV